MREGGWQPWKGGLRNSTRPPVDEKCGRQEAQGCRCCLSPGGGEGTVGTPVFSGLSCVSQDIF